MTSTQLLVIAGHHRSGTTMLASLVNTHPKIAVTLELSQFMSLDRIFPLHMYRLRNPQRHAYVFPSSPTYPQLRWRLHNLYQTLLYAIRVFRGPLSKVQHHDILRSMHAMYPSASYVGDKYPDYIYEMQYLVTIPQMVGLVMYRDPRDVAASTLEAVDRHWKKHQWSHQLNTPAKVARRWMDAMNIASDLADRLYIIRYEDLVANPKAEMARLGEFLRLDPEQFDTSFVFDSSVGSYQQRLTAEQITEVEAIAGPMMSKYGYN